jgi:NADH-quinone oxidoreductase subunit J
MIAMVDWHAFYFTAFALVACAFALAVLFTSNIVRMAFYLVLSLGATSGLFFLAGAEFLGAMQLMIYVGGTLVLLVFGVMLTSQSRFVRMKTSGGDWVFSLLVGGALFVLLLRMSLAFEPWRTPHPEIARIDLSEAQTASHVGLALAGVRLDGGSGYLLPFIIVSVHLLVVLVGSAYLARSKRRADRISA